jgi:hypothetical protein
MFEYYIDFKCLDTAWMTLYQNNGYWDAMNNVES